MPGLRHHWLRALLTLGFLLAGCTPLAAAPVSPSPSETPAPVHLPTTVPPRPPASIPDLAAPAGTAETLPDFSLQPITPQNIRQIVPVAILQDAIALHGSVLSADGKKLAVPSGWGIRVYEVAGGAQIASFPAIGNSVLALSADGSRLAAFYHRPWPADVVILRSDSKSPGEGDPRLEDKTLTVWDVDRRQVLFSQNAEDICEKRPTYDLLQFLEDGALALASVDFDSHIQTVCRISAEDGSAIERMDIDPARGYVRGLAMSTDGQAVAAAFSSAVMGFIDPHLCGLSFSRWRGSVREAAASNA